MTIAKHFNNRRLILAYREQSQLRIGDSETSLEEGGNEVWA